MDAVESAIRLRRMFTLRWSYVNLEKKIFLDKTKLDGKRVPVFDSAGVKPLSG